MKLKRPLLLGIIILSTIVAVSNASANVFQSFDGPLGNRTEALDINNNGDIVGTMLNSPDTTVEGFFMMELISQL